MPVRIYDISKKLGLENKEVHSKAKELGIAAARVASSSLDKITAEYLEDKLKEAHPELAAPPPAAAPPAVSAPATVAEPVAVLTATPPQSVATQMQTATTATGASVGLLEPEARAVAPATLPPPVPDSPPPPRPVTITPPAAALEPVSIIEPPPVPTI